MAFAPSSNSPRFEARLLSLPVAESGELPTMREGLDDLLELLSYARPHDSEGELAFLRDYLLPRLKEAGAVVDADGFGNLWVDVASPVGAAGPRFLWSCHIDTVHAKGGRQGVRFADDGRTVELVKRKPGRCLGADDGAGVWLLLEMIRAGVPGGYVFHRGEEVGRLGSTWVDRHEPERLRGFDACVAFDRRDFDNLITHQLGERCASDAFAESFAAALAGADRRVRYVPDDTGSFTDSYSYAGAIAECANVSVGYDSEHGPRETLDGLHLWRLRNAIVRADFGAVVVERDPADFGLCSWGYGAGAGGWGSGGGSRTGAAAWEDDGGEDLLELVRRYPRAVVEMLGLYGLGADEVAEHMTDAELSGAAAAGLLGEVRDYGSGAGGWAND